MVRALQVDFPFFSIYKIFVPRFNLNVWYYAFHLKENMGNVKASVGIVVKCLNNIVSYYR